MDVGADPGAGGGGFGARVRGVGATALAILKIRLELLATEVEEEKLRLASLLAYAAAAAFFVGFGAVFLALFITVLLWDSQRLLALGIFTAVFLTAGAIAAFTVIRLARRGSRLFASSITELSEDYDALRND